MRSSFHRRLAMLVTTLAIVGCGSKESPPTIAEASQSTDTGSVRIEYRADPEPPREGDNEIEVKVTQADGSPLTDAQVSVTYYMPAMSSMNMPEMRDRFPLAHQDQGTYSGTARLSMGGTWQVTVDVVQTGESIGKKRFTIIARE